MTIDPEIQDELTALGIDNDFSGVAMVAHRGEVVGTLVAGARHRAHGVANTETTRFGIASGTKGFTALTVASLIESGQLRLDTALGSLVGSDELPNVDPRVTVEHLLAHTSGVGDYLDETILTDIDDPIPGVVAPDLATPDGYLPLIAPLPQVSAPGERFLYNNSGYVLLSMVIERVGGASFQELVAQRVFKPAGMRASAFLRSDDLPGDAAVGYRRDGKTNVFHLPVVGGGDGGAFVTAADMLSFWGALLAGEIVSPTMVGEMTAPRSGPAENGHHYGLGFWLLRSEREIVLTGMDPGVSFSSTCHPETGWSTVVLSNTSTGAWPIARYVDGLARRH